jgi:hypothetical protein
VTYHQTWKAADRKEEQEEARAIFPQQFSDEMQKSAGQVITVPDFCVLVSSDDMVAVQIA